MTTPSEAKRAAEKARRAAIRRAVLKNLARPENQLAMTHQRSPALTGGIPLALRVSWCSIVRPASGDAGGT